LFDIEGKIHYHSSKANITVVVMPLYKDKGKQRKCEPKDLVVLMNPNTNKGGTREEGRKTLAKKSDLEP